MAITSVPVLPLHLSASRLFDVEDALELETPQSQWGDERPGHLIRHFFFSSSSAVLLLPLRGSVVNHYSFPFVVNFASCRIYLRSLISLLLFLIYIKDVTAAIKSQVPMILYQYEKEDGRYQLLTLHNGGHVISKIITSKHLARKIRNFCKSLLVDGQIL